MKYLKTDLKILMAIFFGLSLMAWAGEPVEPNTSNQVATSRDQDTN